MKFQTSSSLKNLLLLASIAIPSSTSLWAASRLQTRNANTSDGKGKMEILLSKLKSVNEDLKKLKTEKVENLETKINGYQGQYSAVISGTDIKSGIDDTFKDAKEKMQQFVKDFTEKRKSSMIYDRTSSTSD